MHKETLRVFLAVMVAMLPVSVRAAASSTNYIAELTSDAVQGAAWALAKKTDVTAVQTALQSTLTTVDILAPVTNRVPSDLSSEWWRSFTSEADVIQTNGYSLLNPFDTDVGGYGWRQFSIGAPAGATNVTISLGAKGMTTNDALFRLAVWNQAVTSEIGASNVVITNAHWTNAVLTVPVTAGNSYQILLFSSSVGNCSQASFFVAGIDARFNGTTNAMSFEVGGEHLARNHKSKKDRPYPNSHFRFVSSASSLTFDIFSDNTCDTSMRYVSILTNGVFAGNCVATNTNGLYTISFGSAATRNVQVFNGGNIICDGQNGTWVRRIFSTDSSLIMVKPDETADVLTLGDSMVAGFTVTNMAGAWPYILERNTGLRVETHALGSVKLNDYSASQYTAIRERVRVVQPKAIWVEYGFNDWVNATVTAAQYQTAYSNLVFALAWEAPQARLFLQPILTYNGANNGGGEGAALFRLAVTNVAAMFPRATLVDWTKLAASTEFVGVHPNDTGNVRWGLHAAKIIGDTDQTTNGFPKLPALVVSGPLTAGTLNSTTVNNSGALTTATAVATSATVTTMNSTTVNNSGALTTATAVATSATVTTLNSTTHNNSGALTTATAVATSATVTTLNSTTHNNSGALTTATAVATSATIGTITADTMNVGTLGATNIVRMNRTNSPTGTNYVMNFDFGTSQLMFPTNGNINLVHGTNTTTSWDTNKQICAALDLRGKAFDGILSYPSTWVGVGSASTNNGVFASNKLHFFWLNNHAPGLTNISIIVGRGL